MLVTILNVLMYEYKKGFWEIYFSPLPRCVVSSFIICQRRIGGAILYWLSILFAFLSTHSSGFPSDFLRSSHLSSLGTFSYFSLVDPGDLGVITTVFIFIITDFVDFTGVGGMVDLSPCANLL